MISAAKSTVSLSIQEATQVGEARRLAAAVARGLGFHATVLSTASLLATEAANNLVKHAGGGELIFHCLEDDGAVGMEIISLDQGRGMADVERCMEDGYSTAGSPGTGLGAMARLSSFFDIYSRPGHGTIVLMRLWDRAQPKGGDRRFSVGGVAVPVASEAVSGDAWIAAETPGRLVLMVSDGLGHGPLASEASEEAVRIFREDVNRQPAEFIEAAHSALRATRGAAVAIAEINIQEQIVRFAGIGNIAASIFSQGQSRSLISYNGIVGHQMRKVQEMTYPWPQDGLLFMHSDGILTRWNLDRLPELVRRHPTVIAAAIYRDFKRPRDDVSVATARLME